MFTRIRSGIDLILESIAAFRAYPVLLVPLLCTWALYAPAIVWLRFGVRWDDLSLSATLGLVFSVVVFFSVLISSACLVLLGQIEQIETGGTPRLGSACAGALPNIVKAFPVTLLWSVLWFALVVVEMLLPSRDDDSDDSMDAEGVARVVAGFEGFALSRAFIEALEKGLRMLAFLVYPAIAWEDARPSVAIKRGLGVARAHKAEFATGFVMTEAAAWVVFLPPGIVFLLSDRFDVAFSDWVWVATILYCAFAWSFSIMLEQLFAAELYLWHMLWEKQCALTTDSPPPRLQDVAAPSLIDGLPSLAKVNCDSAPS